jgi:hypothetical protein
MNKKGIRGLTPFFLFLLVTGCGSPAVVNDNESNAQLNNSSIINPDKVNNKKDDLKFLNIELPSNWHLDTSDKVQYYFWDEKGEKRGFVALSAYRDKEKGSFDFEKPNHSSVINDEYIDIPLGKCRLITLEADNGTAASGLTGIHSEYYAVVPIKDKVVYTINFSNYDDKDNQSKEQFIEILNSISSK